MDGVLVDNLECHVEAFKQLGRDHGVFLTDAQVNGVFGRKTGDMLSSLLGRDIDQEESVLLEARKESIYRELASARLPEMVVPGLCRVLDFLKERGMVLALATSGPEENVNLVLDGLGIGSYFSAIVTGEEVIRGKPDPECFLLAARKINISIKECLVFEDSRAGIEAARASGGFPVALATTHSREEISSLGAMIVVDDFEEFLSRRSESRRGW